MLPRQIESVPLSRNVQSQSVMESYAHFSFLSCNCICIELSMHLSCFLCCKCCNDIFSFDCVWSVFIEFFVIG